jgi:hypothetical protein
LKSKPRRKIDARLWRLGALALASTGAERIRRAHEQELDSTEGLSLKALATASRTNRKINSWTTNLTDAQTEEETMLMKQQNQGAQLHR